MPGIVPGDAAHDAPLDAALRLGGARQGEGGQREGGAEHDGLHGNLPFTCIAQWAFAAGTETDSLGSATAFAHPITFLWVATLRFIRHLTLA